MRRPKAKSCGCGGLFQPYVDRFEGETYEALRCSRCGEISYTLDQARIAFTKHKLAQAREAAKAVLKIRKTSGSTVEATIPAGLARAGFRPGRTFYWEVKDGETLVLHLVDAAETETSKRAAVGRR